MSPLMAQDDMLQNCQEAFNVQQDLYKSGVLCLCTEKKNIVMWSHYADKHKGVVIGFKAKDHNSLFFGAHKVRYDQPVPQYAEDDYLNKCIYRKASDWGYENEYRVVVHDLFEDPFQKMMSPKDLCDYRSFSKEEVVEIYTGANYAQNLPADLVIFNELRNTYASLKQNDLVRSRGAYELEDGIVSV
jgi:hypothetical protein